MFFRFYLRSAAFRALRPDRGLQAASSVHPALAKYLLVGFQHAEAA